MQLTLVQGAGVQQQKWALAGTETWSAKGAAGTVAPECNGAAGTGRHRNLECIWPADTGRHRNMQCIQSAGTRTWSAYRRIRTGDQLFSGEPP